MKNFRNLMLLLVTVSFFSSCYVEQPDFGRGGHGHHGGHGGGGYGGHGGGGGGWHRGY